MAQVNYVYLRIIKFLVYFNVSLTHYNLFTALYLELMRLVNRLPVYVCTYHVLFHNKLSLRYTILVITLPNAPSLK